MTPSDHPNDPLFNKTLTSILIFLLEEYGWDGLREEIHIQCFTNNPTIKSSLIFLRKTPWAREKVESLYIATQRAIKKRQESTI